MLIAIPDQEVEIGIDDRCLVAVADAEGAGLNAIDLVGLSLQLLIIARIEDLDLDLAPGGNLVLAQHVANTGYQGGKQGMCPFAEVAPDQELLLQICD